MSKYKDPQTEINKMWHLKTNIVPVILGALGMIKRATDKTLTKYPEVPTYIKRKMHFAKLFIAYYKN